MKTFEEILLLAIQNLDEGILVFDENKNLIFLNKKTEELLGVKREEIFGKNIVEIKELPFFRPIFETVGLTLSNLSGQRIRIDDRKVLEINSLDLLEGGKKKGDLIIMRDLTREVFMEETKTEFITLISHQLRTPISSMRWMVKDLIDGRFGKISEKQKEYLEEISFNIERILHFLNDILSAVRIEEGRYIKKKEYFSLEALVELVIKILKPEMEKREIELKYEKPFQKLPLAKIDVEGMKTVIENLLDNAIRYTPKGGKIEISLKAPVTENEIEFSIKDTGIGIPEKEKEKIFTRFFRASNALRKETEGSGLGLYICKNIIEAHGGKIWFESEEGKGTTFYFKIPVEKE